MGHKGNRGIKEDAKVLGLSNMKKRTFLQRGRRQEEEQSWEGQ